MLVVIMIFNACGGVEDTNLPPNNDCPFEELKTEHNTTTLKKGYEHNFRALLKLGIPIKLASLGVELLDSASISNLVNQSIETGVIFTGEQVLEYNKIVKTICGKYRFIQKLDSTSRMGHLEELYKNLDLYFGIIKNKEKNNQSDSGIGSNAIPPHPIEVNQNANGNSVANASISIGGISTSSDEKGCFSVKLPKDWEGEQKEILITKEGYNKRINRYISFDKPIQLD